MSSERSSLLSSQYIQPSSSGNQRRQHGRTTSSATQRSQMNSSAPDFLSETPDSYPHRSHGQIHAPQHHNYDVRNGMNNDADLMQIDEDLPPNVSSSSISIQRLQRRNQVRSKVLSPSNANGDTNKNGQIPMYDDDEDSDVETNVNINKKSMSFLELETTNHQQEQLLEFEASSTHENSGNNFANVPIEDLTQMNSLEVKPHMSSRQISMGSENSIPQSPPTEKRRFMAKIKQNGLFQNAVSSMGSPVKPMKQPVQNAKRAVSTLFGSTVVMNPSPEEKRLRNRSLLDVVSKPLKAGRERIRIGKHFSPDNYGMEMQSTTRKLPMEDMADMEESYGEDLMQFDDNVAPIRKTVSPTKGNGLRNGGIDIGDPFSYTNQSAMNHRSASLSKDRINAGTNHMGASNIANSWFGGSLNYTSQSTIQMAQDAKNNEHGFFQEHHLLDRLHEEGAKSVPESKLSFEVLGIRFNRLNYAIFSSYYFTSAASSVPITLIPTIAMDVLAAEYGDGDGELEAAASLFASRVATHAVLATAFGKFLNGPLGDIFGARRVSCLYALMLSLSLFFLSFGYSGSGVILCCSAVEYFQSVQWPCMNIILAAHYGNDVNNSKDSSGDDISADGTGKRKKDTDVSKYEHGIYVASLGSRMGTLSASISTTILLRYIKDSWRAVARLAAMSSLMGCITIFLFITDSPHKIHDPQNPVKDMNMRPLSVRRNPGSNIRTTADVLDSLFHFCRVAIAIFTGNIVPSVRSVLSNVTFWVVAIAHSGGLMVNSSVRILGTYFRDTSYGTISENEAGAVTMFLSVGVLFGLAVGGKAFANLSNNAFARKRMVSNLYILTVVMCYLLAFLAIPFVRKALISSTLVALIQGAASFLMGASVAVQVYCIPAIVACTFGANKGLYSSYTDGVASVVSSWVWRIVGNAVQEGNPQGSGWFFGWAAIALLVILAGMLMTQFVEFYFCRGGLRNIQRRSSIDEESSIGNTSISEILKPPFSPFRNREVKSLLSVAGDDDDDDISTVVFEEVSLPIDFDGIESSTSSDRNKKQQVLDLLEFKGNEKCVDCEAPFPRWCSILLPNLVALSHRGASDPLPHQVGCFCCTECAGIHRKLGKHLAFVRSVDYDEFETNEVNALRRGGNIKVNEIYESLLRDTSAKPSSLASMNIRERFIVTKYEKKLWYQYNHRNNFSHIDTSQDTTLTSIELVVNHQNDRNTSTVKSGADFDRSTREKYNAFVEADDFSDVEEDSIPLEEKKGDDASLSSEDSSGWHIEITDNKGLDELVNL
ncbi:hypothetical protein CTEN210_00130 [Chaetoceros tenuissimus]|uniref:Arf-GAP domain-containing protein n=1 Tax=Chaetoceros tenuissimus TaxID=426638 RepID=A0AAD3CCP7_9STRA|nr:hypothetical protein CTEN210_00130 [Chaetoceros tenuissimus]